MELLPDEMLVAIFSFLSPEDLLGAVPLVCKRWCGIARSKAVWRNTSVEYQLGHELDVARVVRLAPALGSLRLDRLEIRLGMTFEELQEAVDSNEVTDFQLNVCTLVQSLLTGVSDVKYLRMQGFKIDPHLFPRLLSKYADTLVELDVVDIIVIPEEYDNQILVTIAGMPELKSLRLVRSRLPPYCGQLRSGCESLKKFIYKPPFSSAGGDSMVLDVLDNCGDRLTYLELKFLEQRPCSVVRKSVFQCSGLRKARLPCLYLPAVRDMAYLSDLKLDLDVSDMDMQDAIEVAEFINSSSVMANLSCLSMVISVWNVKDETILTLILSALAGTCSELAHLKVGNYSLPGRWIREEDLNKLFHTRSKLEDLHLKTISLYTRRMELIACLPRLRALTLSVKIEIEDKPAINEILKGMTTRQPAVQVNVACRETYSNTPPIAYPYN